MCLRAPNTGDEPPGKKPKQKNKKKTKQNDFRRKISLPATSRAASRRRLGTSGSRSRRDSFDERTEKKIKKTYNARPRRGQNVVFVLLRRRLFSVIDPRGGRS